MQKLIYLYSGHYNWFSMQKVLVGIYN